MPSYPIHRKARRAVARARCARIGFALGCAFGLEASFFLMAGASLKYFWVGIVPLVAMGALGGLVAWSGCAALQWEDARRRRRAMRPACHHCGYLMIGSVSMFCPECGNRYRRGWLGPRLRPWLDPSLEPPSKTSRLRHLLQHVATRMRAG